MKHESWYRITMRALAGAFVMLVPVAAGLCLGPPGAPSNSGVSFQALASAFDGPAKATNNAEVRVASNLNDWTYTSLNYGAFFSYQSHEIQAFYREENAENKAFTQAIQMDYLTFLETPGYTTADYKAFVKNENAIKSAFAKAQAAEIKAFNKALAQQLKDFKSSGGILSPILPHDTDDGGDPETT